MDPNMPTCIPNLSFIPSPKKKNYESGEGIKNIASILESTKPSIESQVKSQI